MAKRIPRIGYIEFSDDSKVDIINVNKRPDGAVDIIAVDGLYQYRDWQTIEEITGPSGVRLKVMVPRASLHMVVVYPNGSYELFRRDDFLKFVLFRGF